MLLRILALVLGLLPAPLAAGPDAPPVEVRLLAGWTGAGGEHVAAIDIRLAPGWHTYWRAPGGTGIPPSFDWSESRNLASVGYEWPRPEVFDSFGMRTIGYPGGVLLPVRLTPETAGEPILVRLSMTFGVCKDICIRAEAALDGEFHADGSGPEASAEDRRAIAAMLAERPRDPREAGVETATCRMAPKGRGHEVIAEVRFRAAPEGEQVAVIEAGGPGIWVGEARAHIDGTLVTATADMETGTEAGAVDHSTLRITLIDAARVVDIRGCAAPG